MEPCLSSVSLIEGEEGERERERDEDFPLCCALSISEYLSSCISILCCPLF